MIECSAASYLEGSDVHDSVRMFAARGILPWTSGSVAAIDLNSNVRTFVTAARAP